MKIVQDIEIFASWYMNGQDLIVFPTILKGYVAFFHFVWIISFDCGLVLQQAMRYIFVCWSTPVKKVVKSPFWQWEYV